MNTSGLFNLLLMAPPPEGGQGGGGAQTLIMMVLFMVIFWVLLIRPQRMRQKEHERRIAALKKGDQIVTSGGIHGLITAVRDREITLKIADGVHIDLDRAAVAIIKTSKDGPESASSDPAKKA